LSHWQNASGDGKRIQMSLAVTGGIVRVHEHEHEKNGRYESGKMLRFEITFNGCGQRNWEVSQTSVNQFSNYDPVKSNKRRLCEGNIRNPYDHHPKQSQETARQTRGVLRGQTTQLQTQLG
jgi:hypothetical protein